MLQPRLCLIFIGVFTTPLLWAQPVTGVWRGKVQKGNGLLGQVYKLELKLVKTGDSLVGTSYYYGGPNTYSRYRVKGYFDDMDNAIHWWDDELIENKGGQSAISLGYLKNQPLRSAADFNCPGGGTMHLDGQAESDAGLEYEIHLSKMDDPQFADEWDPVIADYFYGMADPDIIDSVDAIARYKPPVLPQPKPEVVKAKPPPSNPDVAIKKAEPIPPKPIPVLVSKPPVPLPPVVAMAPPLSITDKYIARKKIITTTIPFSGDSIMLQFYDNAEVDGDSISLFLNGTLIFEHIRLTEGAYTINLPTGKLAAENELTMVAENLGSIPPNTSFMMAYANGKRYTARLESTENSSAVIKLVKEKTD